MRAELRAWSERLAAADAALAVVDASDKPSRATRGPRPRPGELTRPAAGTDPAAPTVDPERFAVVFRGVAVELGNGLLFRLASALLRRPGLFAAETTLHEVVWLGSAVTPSAVHAAVSRLRATLRDGGLPDLADALEGDGGCYRFDPAGPAENASQM